MPSLFFWRKKRLDAGQADVRVASAPTTAEPGGQAQPPPPIHDAPTPQPPKALPVQRMVYALALRDERAADADTRPEAAHTQLLMAAAGEFALVGKEPRYTPRQPSLLPQLLEAVNDEDASLRALSRIVAQDPGLTGELLRWANSPMYRVSATPVESVERATAVLGTQGIRSLIASRLVQPLAGTGGQLGHFGEVIWASSLYSASAAEAWAARAQDADPFAAHLLALLHGLGSVTAYRVLNDLYAARPTLVPDAAALAGALQANAASAAARIAANWGLSERTCQALEAQSAATASAELTPLARALRFGLLAGALTLLCKNGRLTEEQATQQLEAAGFTGAQTSRVWDRMLQAYARH